MTLALYKLSPLVLRCPKQHLRFQMEHQRQETKAMEEATSPSGHLRCSGSDELGQSMRVYCAATGRVPFEWEDEPGKPKSPPRVDVVLPLCPSPAMQSARLADRDGGRQRRRLKRRMDPSSEPDGFEGCLPVKFHLGRAIKRWDIICFFRGE